MSPHERTRRLEIIGKRILYLHRREEQVNRFHVRRRRKELRAAGVDLRRAKRCKDAFLTL